MIWQTSRYAIDLAQAKIMGILNLTPDSFSDGGRFSDVSQALHFAEQLVADGADMLDLGAESTRPGSTAISAEVELKRLLPVLTEVLKWGLPISVDTSKSLVMKAALDAGADIVNDVWALRQDGALEVVAQHKNCGVCLMHMHGEPKTMQQHPMHAERFGGAMQTVKDFLFQRSQILQKLGVAKNRIVWDVGIGFGKTVEQNFELLAKQTTLAVNGYPLLCAWSRKSSLVKMAGIDPDAPVVERLAASIAAVVIALERGSRLLRVHDVLATRQAIKIWQAARKPFD